MPVSLDDVKDVERKTRALFTYKADPEGKDDWSSNHAEVLRGERFYADCDSLTSTVANLIALQGEPLSNLWFAHVDSNGDSKIDHMIGFWLDTTRNIIYVIGDTFGPCYPAMQMQHKLKTACRINNILSWYKVADYRNLVLIPAT